MQLLISLFSALGFFVAMVAAISFVIFPRVCANDATEAADLVLHPGRGGFRARAIQHPPPRLGDLGARRTRRAALLWSVFQLWRSRP